MVEEEIRSSQKRKANIFGGSDGKASDHNKVIADKVTMSILENPLADGETERATTGK